MRGETESAGKGGGEDSWLGTFGDNASNLQKDSRQVKVSM